MSEKRTSSKGSVTRMYPTTTGNLATTSVSAIQGQIGAAGHDRFLPKGVLAGTRADDMRASSTSGGTAVSRTSARVKRIFAQGMLVRHRNSGKKLTVLRASKDLSKVIVIDRNGRKFKALKKNLEFFA